MPVTILIMVLVTVCLPFAFIVVVVTTQLREQRRRLEALLAERRLLIEQGVTNLPPVRLPGEPTVSRRADRLRNLKAAIILLALAAGLAVAGAVGPSRMLYVDNGLVSILAALGLGLLAIHFLAMRYGGSEGNADQEDSAEDADAAL